ncbi:MAG: hypothetical protein IT173_02475 [Acidobacteria bacterium]|jgi:hypothetical protein|nr:hypothetical protein [Acidobacteriota bacterium]
MKGILKFVRRNIVRRRFVVLWLGIMAIELLCPSLHAIGTNAAPPLSGTTTLVSNVVDERGESETAISNCENDCDHEPVGDCNDECLCHAVAIPGIVGDVQTSSVYGTSIPLKNGYPVFNSLPPPYLPPKFS